MKPRKYMIKVSCRRDMIKMSEVTLDTVNHFITLSQTTNLDSSKLKEFADDNFKFDEKWKKIIQEG